MLVARAKVAPPPPYFSKRLIIALIVAMLLAVWGMLGVTPAFSATPGLTIDAASGKRVPESSAATSVSFDTTDLFSVELVGRGWRLADRFGYVITPRSIDGSSDPTDLRKMPLPDRTAVDISGTSIASDAVSFGFGRVAFSAPGEYRYLIRAVPTEVDDVLASSNECELVVEVRDTDSGLAVQASLGGSPRFANALVEPLDYVAAGGLIMEMTYEGREIEGNHFSFNVFPRTQVSADKIGQQLNTSSRRFMPAAAAGDASRLDIWQGKELKFTSKDVGLELHYTVRQESGGDGFITYDTTESEVRIKVSEDSKGRLVATTTVTKGVDVRSYVYVAGDSPAADPAKIRAEHVRVSVMVSLDRYETKLEGRPWGATDRFSYSIAPYSFNANTYPPTDDITDPEVVSKMPMPERSTVVVQGTDGGTQDIGFGFGDIAFDSYGTYKYKIVQTDCNDPDVSQSTLEAMLEVEVRFSYDSYGPEAVVVRAQTTFANTYYKPIDFVDAGSIIVETVLDGQDIGESDLTFSVTAEDFPTADKFNLPYGAAKEFHVPAAGEGEVSAVDIFAGEDIKFSVADRTDLINPGVYTFRIVAKNEGKPGYVYDPVEYRLQVMFNFGSEPGTMHANVVQMEPKPTWPGGWWRYQSGVVSDQPATFRMEHTYRPVAEVSTDLFKKKFAGIDWAPNHRFHFTMNPYSFNDDTDPAVVGKMPAPAKREVYVSGPPGTRDVVDFGFGLIEFYDVGKYVYEVKETPVPVETVAVDERKVYLTVNVVEDGAGQLKAEHVLSDDPLFVNQWVEPLDYVAAGGMTVKTSIDGREIGDGELAFSVKPLDQLSADKLGVSSGSTVEFPVPASAAGDSSLVDVLEGRAFEFTLFDVGKKFSYTIEPKGKEPPIQGCAYDTDPRTVEISISYAGQGKMIATTTVTKGSDVQTYTYATGKPSAPGPVVIDVQHSYKPLPAFFDTKGNAPDRTLFGKTLIGRDWRADDVFEFSITPVDGAPAPQRSSATVRGDAGGGPSRSFDFGTIEFAQTGDYQYKLNERDHSIGGVSHDDHTGVLNVKVHESGGQLYASGNAVLPWFTNYYAPTLDYTAAGGMRIDVALEGRGIASGQFGFAVKPVDQASADALGLPMGGAVFEAPAAGDLTASSATSSFNLFADHLPVAFDPSDAGKTYRFSVVQVDRGVGGYSYDLAPRMVEVAVSDDGRGSLVAVTTVSGGPDARSYVYRSGDAPAADAAKAGFLNRYDAARTTVSVEGMKSMEGRGLSGGEFSFVVSPINDSSIELAVASNDALGAVRFNDISFGVSDLDAAVAGGWAMSSSLPDGGRMWIVELQAWERPLSAPGVTAAESEFSFCVEVVDAGAGALSSRIVYPASGLAFANAYSAGSPVSVTPHGAKVFSAPGGQSPASVESAFSFRLRALDGGPLPARGGEMALNDAVGNVVFGPIEFDQSLLADVSPDPVTKERSKHFTYEVAESGSVPGVTNDPDPKRFSYTLTDHGDGTMEVFANPGEGALFVFENSYRAASVESSPTDSLSVQVELSGRAIVDGEFAFELAAAGPSARSALSHGTSDAAGKVSMSSVAFDSPGEYCFLLRQVPGHPGDGVSYDSSEFGVHASVIDDGRGSLVATWSFEDGAAAATFRNSYAAAPAEVVLGASVTLEGAPLEPGMFSFEASRLGFGAMRASNAANGSVSFDPASFDAPGEYVFRVSQVDPVREGYVWDDFVHEVRVLVADDLKGSLVASVEGSPVFANRYEERGPVDPPSPPASVDPSDPSGGGSGNQSGSNASNGESAGAPRPLVRTGDVVPFRSVALLAVAASVLSAVAFLALRRRLQG